MVRMLEREWKVASRGRRMVIYRSRDRESGTSFD